MTETLIRTDAPGDAELISAVRGGDLSAYGTLFERHVDSARRLARQLVNHSDADDLVSDAFSKVLGVLQRGGGPDLAFRAYLLTSVRRLHIDKIRAGKKLHSTDDMEKFDPGVPFRDTAVEGFENEAAAKAFSSLPERWQLVLWHLEVEGQKPADIAPLLGMSANSVSALAYRAREGLRQAFLSQHAQEVEEDTCRWTQEHLGGYIRKGLSKRDIGKVEDHLDDCVKCMGVYLELTEVNSNLGAILAPLLLGGAGASYFTATMGVASKGVLLLFLDRAKDTLANNVPAAVAGTAATVAVVAAGAFLALREPAPADLVSEPPPVVITTPSATPPPSSPKPSPEPAPSATATPAPTITPTASPGPTPAPTATQPPAPTLVGDVSLSVTPGQTLVVRAADLVDGSDSVWFDSATLLTPDHAELVLGSAAARTTAARAMSAPAARPETFSYTPADSWAGTDRVSFVITDTAGHRLRGTLTLSTPNSAPVADDLAVTTRHATSVSIDVLSHVSDRNVPGTDQVLTPGIAAGPEHGKATVNRDGTISYTPNLVFLAGTDTFDYVVSDGAGGTDTATVTVTVTPANPTNQPPTAGDDEGSAMVEQQTTIDVLANDSDPDLGDSLRVTAVSGVPAGVDAAPTASGDGVVLTAHRAGTFTFGYTVSDQSGATDTAQVTVHVSPAPTFNVGLNLAEDPNGMGNVDLTVTPTITNAPDGWTGTLVVTSGIITINQAPAPGCTEIDANHWECPVDAASVITMRLKQTIGAWVRFELTALSFTDSDSADNVVTYQASGLRLP